MNSSESSTSTENDGPSWSNVYGLAASAVATVAVVICVLRPITLRLPKRCFPRSPAWLSFTLDFGSAPVIACCLLAAIGVLTGQGILSGLRGNDSIQPYSIIVIFFGLAYMSISFDVQGVFECLALFAVKSSGSSGRKLFFFFWLVTSVVTVVASNDVAILTITPIICHFTHKLGVNPIPFLLSEFMAANIWSMTLFIGNPTNIIVGVAYKMSFIGYTLWMGLPAIICGVSHFLMMLVIMRKQIPAIISASAAGPIRPLSAIKSRSGAIFGCLAMGSCITLLCVSYWLKVELWVLCGAFWALYFSRDLISDVFFRKCHKRTEAARVMAVESPESDSQTIALAPVTVDVDEESSAVISEDISQLDNIGEDSVPLSTPKKQQPEDTAPAWIVDAQHRMKDRMPTIYAVFARMPWKILPFVLGMFVLVQCLKDVGWVNNAAWLISSFSGSSFILSIFVSGFITALSALVLNNQPATILFTMILKSTTFANEKVGKAWSLGLILGSNLCANYTIFGALAGIMFIAIVRAHGVEIKASTFSKIGFLIMPFITAVGCGVIAAELALFPDGFGQ